MNKSIYEMTPLKKVLPKMTPLKKVLPKMTPLKKVLPKMGSAGCPRKYKLMINDVN